MLLSQAKDGQWFAMLRAGNHQVVSVTEMYKRRQTALKAASKMGVPVMEHDAKGRLTPVEA